MVHHLFYVVVLRSRHLDANILEHLIGHGFAHIFWSSKRARVLSLSTSSGPCPFFMLLLTSSSMVARTTSSVTLLYLATRFCNAFCSIPLVPLSPPCSKTRRDAGFSVSRYNCVGIFVCPVELSLHHRNKRMTGVHAGNDVGWSDISLDQTRVRPSTTASLLRRSRKSPGFRPSNFVSSFLALLVAAVVGRVPDDDVQYFAQGYCMIQQ